MKAGYVWLCAGALCACSASALIGTADGDGEDGGSAQLPGGTAGSQVNGNAGAGGDGSSNAAGQSNVSRPDGSDPLFPYPNTDYAEPFRGQFHFSTASGWMNDVDGLWYAEGVYHLSYQASPYAFQGGKNLHWAHATSKDLLHWQQQPLMLVPGGNVEGEAWSGSVVVDTDNSAGLQVGSTPSVVAFYTSTKLGTSLAYSNDAGATWQAFAQNPLAIGDASYQTNRDPAVFWHAASKRWVCAYWQDGTTFYTSPDLKTWTRASNISFGDVVPDFYELPLDGDAANTRSVLQDAGGNYLVGKFDGQTFTPDASGPQDMDVGAGFFASHTFFRQTFPDLRVVQMAWLRDSGVATAPWRGSATFPVELRLKTFASGLKVTRTPIVEIEELYTVRHHWDGQTLAAGKNLLTGVRSKTFDLELVIDTAKTKASAITLQIANKTVVYDLAKQTLDGSALAPLDGRITLRLLADWGSLEVFANGGELSMTEAFAFTPEDHSLSVTGDAALSVVSADFREIGRTWPGNGASEASVLDDADADYESTWNIVTGDATFFDGTCHFSAAPGAAVEATFTGTRVDWYGLRNTDLGKVDVYIDDTLVAEAVDCYGPARVSAQLLSLNGLTNAPHTIRVLGRTDKNDASTGTAVVHDYFVFSTEP